MDVRRELRLPGRDGGLCGRGVLPGRFVELRLFHQRARAIAQRWITRRWPRIDADRRPPIELWIGLNSPRRMSALSPSRDCTGSPGVTVPPARRELDDAIELNLGPVERPQTAGAGMRGNSGWLCCRIF